ncbi:MAG: hypothetical protein LBS59_08085 [Puniceicoccales bacterium]|jgi:HEAT repeat protein|nr:hypothetical protein [Puniceicoccales bacterium]
MRLKNIALLFFAFFSCILTGLGAGIGAPDPFIPVLPENALTGKVPEHVRELALRTFVFTNGVEAARNKSFQTADPVERRILLDALGAAEALRKRDESPLIALCTTADPADAIAGLPLLALVNSGTRASTNCFRGVMRHADPTVRAVAARAASQCRAGASLVPDFLALTQSLVATDRRAGVNALVGLGARGESAGDLGSTPYAIAEALLRKDAALAGDIVFALLRAGYAVPDRLFPLLDALTDGALTGVVERHGDFPNLLDSNFLRRTATGSKPRAAATAAALLASRDSVKNNATLKCLADVLTGGSREGAAAIAANLATDSEFALVPRWSEASPSERATNDRFGGIGSLPASFVEGLSANFRSEWRRVGWHIPVEQRPDIPDILWFLRALEKASRDDRLDSATRTRAYEILLIESGSPQLSRIIYQILLDGSPVGVQIALRTGLRHPDDPRLLEPSLLSLATGVAAPDFSAFTALAPFLDRYGSFERSRILANAGRKLATAGDAYKKTLAFALLASHGAPTDTALAMKPALESPSVLVRRSAFHALAQLSPEVFMLRLKTIAADPDPLARETAPLAFFRTGFRWEHHLNGTVRVPQWVQRDMEFPISEENFATLRGLLNDPVAEIRFNAMLALAQHGRLENVAPLLELCAAGDTPLLTARVARSVAAAHAANLAVPPALAKFLPPPRLPEEELASPTQNPPSLAIFVSPSTARASTISETVSTFRAARPGLRVSVFFTNSDASGTALRKLRKHFPVSFNQQHFPILIFSSGAWFASTRAPDFAHLCELADHATHTGSRRVENALEEAAIAAPEEVRNAIANTEFPHIKEPPKADLFEAILPPLTGENVFIFFVACSVIAALLIIVLSKGLRWRRRRIEKAAMEIRPGKKK